MSKYFESLPGDIKQRYMDKCALISNIDPHTLIKGNLRSDLNNLPKVEILDVALYFTSTYNVYTGEQIKAYKSLESYKYYDAGFVLKVEYQIIGGNFVIVGQVKYMYYQILYLQILVVTVILKFYFIVR